MEVLQKEEIDLLKPLMNGVTTHDSRIDLSENWVMYSKQGIWPRLSEWFHSKTQLTITNPDSANLNDDQLYSCASATDSAFGHEEIIRLDFLKLLPYELAVRILTLIDNKDCLSTYFLIAQVSVKWNSLATDSEVWRCWFFKRFPIAFNTDHPPEYYCHFSRQHSRQTSSKDIVPKSLTKTTSPSTPSAQKKLKAIVKQRSTIDYARNPYYGAKKIDLTRDWRHLYKQRLRLYENWLYGRYSVISLEGHTDAVYCIQFDEKRIVSGSRDQTIKYWKLPTLTCTKELTGHAGSVLCLQYNSKYLVSGSSDSLCIIWDFESGDRLRTLSGHSSAVLDVRINDSYVVSCSKDGFIKVWDIETGDLRSTLTGHVAAVNAIYLYNNIITSASGDCLVKIWDAETGTLLRDLHGHQRGLACVQFDGETIVSGSNDKTIRVWNASTGECMRVIESHTKLVRTLCFDDNWIVTGSYDESVKVFERHGKGNDCVLDLQNMHKSWVFHVQMSLAQIVSADQDHKIVIWDFTEGVEDVDQLIEISQERLTR